MTRRAAARIVVATSLAMLGAVSPAAPADADDLEVHVGLGASLQITDPLIVLQLADAPFSPFLPIGFANLHIPVKVSRFRVEPLFGVISSSGTEAGFDNTSTTVHLGLDLGYETRLDEAVSVHVGPRVGLVHQAQSTEGGGLTSSMKRTDTYVGVSVGAEYYFTPHLSLGGQVQLNAVLIGDEQVETDGVAGESESDVVFFATHSLLTIRWYFL